jgi:histidine ammonia-lyase
MNEGYIGPDVSVPNVISPGNGQAAGLTFAFGQLTTATADTAQIAATTFSRKVNWVAWGYRKS